MLREKVRIFINELYGKGKLEAIRNAISLNNPTDQRATIKNNLNYHRATDLIQYRKSREKTKEAKKRASESRSQIRSYRSNDKQDSARV